MRTYVTTGMVSNRVMDSLSRPSAPRYPLSMRRPVLALAGCLALACAGKAKPPPAAPPPPAPVAMPMIETTKAPDEILTEYDLTHDGKPDVWKYSRKGPDGKEIVVRKEKDLNGDGKIDSWEFYGPDGSLAKLVYDMDFDGKPDVVLFFEKDQLVRKEYAFGFDGKPRSWNYYEKGKLARKERDTNGDGKVDYWEYWVNGEIDRIGYDEDGDGQVDRWESRHTETAEAPAGTPPAAK